MNIDNPLVLASTGGIVGEFSGSGMQGVPLAPLLTSFCLVNFPFFPTENMVIGFLCM